MKRTAGILVALTLAGCLLATGPAGAGNSATARAGCLKIWHEKKITKVIRKNGKLKKVTVIKRYWTCDPYQAPGPPRLGIAATEWKFTLSRPRIKAGRLLLEFTNRGEDSHNLQVATVKGRHLAGSVPDTETGDVTDSAFRLKPGLYQLWCSLPNHARLGMKAKLRVVR